MVTLIKYGALSGGEKYNVNQMWIDGLSTEQGGKPTTIIDGMPIPNGSVYTEVDTGKTYMFDKDNTTWHEVSIGGGGGTSGGIVLVGETTTTLTDNATTNPIMVDGQSYAAQPNDAVIYGNKEFLFDGTKWHEFGDLSGLSSKDIGAMTNYVKAQTGAAITTTDTLNQAIGKVEKRVDDNETNILFKANTSDVNTATANLQNQINNIITPVTQDAEVQNARVGADGTSYQALKARLDAEYDALSNRINKSVAYKGKVQDNSITDINNAKTSGIYMVGDYTGISNLPLRNDNIPYTGILVVMSNEYTDNVDRLFQLYYSSADTSGAHNLFFRYCWNGAWSSWDIISTATNVNAAISNVNSNIDFVNSRIDELISGGNNIDLTKYTDNIITATLLAGNTLIGSPSNRTIWIECSPNTKYIIDRGILNKYFGIATSEDAPVLNSTTINVIATDEDKSINHFEFATSSNAKYLYIQFYHTSVDTNYTPEQILASISVRTDIDIHDITPDFSLFENFGIIGDSYASGEIYIADASSQSGYRVADYYNLSWGQIIARKCGSICTNFSKGGLTTETWLTDSRGLALLQSETAKNIIVCCLGLNDASRGGSEYIGNVSDIGTDNNTFYANYGKIISAIATKSAATRIIMSTLPHVSWISNSLIDMYNVAIKAIALHFSVPIMDITDDYYYTSINFTSNMVANHPTAINYAGMAKANQRLLENMLINNPTFFKEYIGL